MILTTNIEESALAGPQSRPASRDISTLWAIGLDHEASDIQFFAGSPVGFWRVASPQAVTDWFRGPPCRKRCTSRHLLSNPPDGPRHKAGVT